MSKFLSVLVAAMFAAVSVNAIAAKHMAAEKGAVAEKKEVKKEEKKEMKKEAKKAAAKPAKDDKKADKK